MISSLIRFTGVLAFSLVFATACQTTQPAPTESDSGAGESEGNLGDRGDTTGGTLGGSDLETVYFDYDASTLSQEARQLLRHNAAVLKANGSSRLEIQGNCDERGTEEYNLALGKRRAEAAKRYISDLGVSGSRVATVSFGEENPAVRGSSESAWARNRRDDFVLR